MLGNVSPLDFIGEKYFIDKIESLGRITSRLTRPLSKDLEAILQEYKILTPVQYLLSSGFSSRVPFYVLFTKDFIKVIDKDASTCYCWNTESFLWEEVKNFWVEKVYLKEYIERIYLTYYHFLEGLDKIHPLNKKDDNMIYTFGDLLEQLLEMKDQSISIVKLREIFYLYVSQMVDKDFFKMLDPIGFLATKNYEMVDLKTGNIRKRTKNDYFTKEVDARYIPDIDSQLLNKTIHEIMLHDKEKIHFLQEILGYSITGDCREGKLLMLIGETRAGKSIIINLLEATLGKYGTFLNKSIIINNGNNKSSDAPDPFLAELKGIRVGVINELKQEDVINTSKFKTLVTNEKYTYRQLNSNYIEKVQSRHVLMVASNHKPIFPETDQSIWERLWIIMCNAKFVDDPQEKNEFKIDRTLRDKLIENHKDAFLKWLIDGAIRFYKKCEIKIPLESIEALDEYKSASQDENELYFLERIDATDDENDRIQSSYLYNDYKQWARDNNVRKIMSQTGFSETMKRKGFKKKKNNNYFFLCIKLKQNEMMNI